jgi:hypothetical protein
MVWSQKGTRAEIVQPTRAKAKRTIDTVTRYDFNFIAIILNILDDHNKFNVHFIVMNSASIHMAEKIEKYIVSCNYGCIHLLLCLSRINPIGQLWFVVKNKLKRENLLDNGALRIKVSEACNKVLLRDLKDFCRYSASKFDVCLKKSNFKFGSVCHKWFFICANLKSKVCQ